MEMETIGEIMAKRFDKIVVVDLEATCWDEDTLAGIAEKGEQDSEVIEIGVCAYYVQSGEVKDKMSILVRPENSTISEYCTNLTGHTWEGLRKHGMPYEGAVNKLRKHYGPKHRVMACWGNYDWYMISQQCLREDLPFPFGRSYINVKELHAITRRLDKALGLGAALEHEELEFIGTPHRGDDDAYNIAIILKKLLEEKK